MKGIAPIGTLEPDGRFGRRFLADATRFGAIVTTTPEELALREALETAAAIRERLGIVTIAAIINWVPDSLFDTAELAAASPLGEPRAPGGEPKCGARTAHSGAQTAGESGLQPSICP